MNKNYIKPELEVTEIYAANIIATSPLKAVSDSNASSSFDVLSKEMDFGSDDEEDEW